MSVYRRAPHILRRAYASKAASQHATSQDAVTDADGEPVYTSLEQLFDDDDLGLGPIDLPDDLPVSPIMDEKQWARRFKQDKKQGPPHPSEMPADELALMRNPYANALMTNIRQDAWYRRSMPSFFLQKLQVRVHPDSKDPWILPVGIRSRDASKVTPGTSKYIGANYAAVDFLKMRRYKKLQDQRFVISAVWRRDMADFVLAQLQNRVYEEVAACQRWIMSANRDGGKWEDMQLGCLLVWEDVAPTDVASTGGASASTTGESGAGLASGVEQDAGSSITEKKEKTAGPGVTARTLVEVKGKLVPSYKMHLLLRREQAAELKKQLKIEPVVRKNVVLSSARTMKAQTWLWRLAGYRRRPGASLFGDIDAARRAGDVDN